MSTATVVPYAPTPLTINAEVGESQRAFAEQTHAEYENAIASGTCHPFTIINFNPVPLDMTGVLKRYRIPSPDDNRLPPDVMRMSLEFDGQERRGHALTIRYPLKDGKMLDAKSPTSGSLGEPIVSRSPKLYWPKEVAYKITERFSPVFVAIAAGGVIQPAAPKDARRIYGVLAFEGDIHTLERVLEEDDPAKRIINVPVCHMRTIGKTSIPEFRTLPYSFDEYIAQMFAGQRKYADAVITKAQQKFAGGTDDEIKDISEVDRVWYRWAINMGFAKAPGKDAKTWLTEYMTLVGADTRTSGNQRKCQSCRTPEPEPGTPFCPKCSAPINTFKTFMDGFPVPEAWLMALRGDEREIVLAELKLRKEGFGEAPVVVTAPKTPRGPYKRSGGDKPELKAEFDPITDEVPVAELTALPGEED